MADKNMMVKDFVNKQFTPINIGVPRERTSTTETAEERRMVSETPAVKEAQAAPERVEAAPVRTPKKVGRPKSEIEKVKVSLYIPAETKERIVKLQHRTMKSCMNDVLMEAIDDILKKYDI